MWALMVSMAFGCEKLDAPVESLQVAWVSPRHASVFSRELIEVVSLKELRSWVAEEEEADALLLLQQLGQLRGTKKKKVDPSGWKITVFDIRAETLCRPMADLPVDSVVAGLPICVRRKHKPVDFAHRHGDTGCGYTANSTTEQRGFDVYRVAWRDASAYGFCVLPLSRFLEEG